MVSVGSMHRENCSYSPLTAQLLSRCGLGLGAGMGASSPAALPVLGAGVRDPACLGLCVSLKNLASRCFLSISRVSQGQCRAGRVRRAAPSSRSSAVSLIHTVPSPILFMTLTRQAKSCVSYHISKVSIPMDTVLQTAS